MDAATPRFKPVLVVAYNTGMRAGELQKLEWSHIDREGGFIRLPKEITESDKPRNIPINHHVGDALESLPRTIMRHNNVFTTHRGRPFVHQNGFINPFKDACELAGVPYGRMVENGTTFHDIRRTVKTNMLEAGIQKEYRDLIVGHGLKGKDKHYLAPSEERLKEAMARFTDLLDGQLENANVDQNVDQKITI